MSGKRKRAAGLIVGGRIAYGIVLANGKLGPNEERVPSCCCVAQAR